MSKIIYNVVLAIVLLIGSRCAAITYQVGPDKPYPDLQSVAPLLGPGDVVEVDGNQTYPGGVVFTEEGSPTAKITIRGLPQFGQRPIISGGTNTVTFETPWPYSGPGADHYIFEGFEITAGSFRGIYHQADDLTVRDCVVHDCPAHGILGADSGSGSLTLEYVEVYNCGNGSSQHQLYIATDEVNHPGSVFRMQHCFIHDGIGGNNVKSRAERNEIYYNWIEGAYYHELELIGPDGADPTLKREDSDVVGNVLWKRNTFYVTRVGGDGTGETDGRYRFVNNTIICGTSAVFRIFDGIESIEMHNNVFYRPGGANICRTVEAEWSTGVELIAGSNNWVVSGSSNIPTQWTDTLYGSDPGFLDYSNSDPRPSVGSPMIDQGSSVLSGPPGYPFPNPLFPPTLHPPLYQIEPVDTAQARPSDLVIDMGAFEWCLGGTAPGVVLQLELLEDKQTMIWETLLLANSYDVIKGSLTELLANGGDYSTAILTCLENDTSSTTASDPAQPGSGSSFFYLVRGLSCDHLNGTYDSGGMGQLESRDSEIASAPNTCP
ncbi:hypothetical protein JXQ70_02285 [bacterium]|nr:hypothetical protein [bacterium]